MRRDGPVCVRRRPAGRRAAGWPAGAGESDVPDPPFALIHGLFALLRNLAIAAAADTPRGVVVVVDDAHWADSHSMRFLAYLGERLATLPVAIVISVRTGETGSGPARSGALRSCAGPGVLALKSLSDRAVAEVVRDRLPDATGPFIAACARLTTGNPFLLASADHEVQRLELVPDARTAAESSPTCISRR